MSKEKQKKRNKMIAIVIVGVLVGTSMMQLISLLATMI